MENKNGLTGQYLEDVARFLVRELRPDFEKDKYTCNLHNTDMTCPYDVEMIVFNRITGKKLKTYFIEVKIRFEDYATIALEKKKVDGITKEIKKYKERTSFDIEIEILYLSVHPSGSYLFNISNMSLTYENWTGTKKSTMFNTKDTDAGDKQAAFLNKYDGKKFDWTSSTIIQHYENSLKSKVVKPVKVKDIFDFN
jgi:hypothetical protein